MSEDFMQYFDIEEFGLYQLTLTREMLNEVMNILSSKEHVNVTVNGEGHIGFDIPSDSDVRVRSINIVAEMMEKATQIEKEMQDTDNPIEKTDLKKKKEELLAAIDIVSDIIICDSDKGDTDVDGEKEDVN